MRYCLFLLCIGAAFGQGTETKPKAEDYEVHASARNAEIGAEYMVHSFSRGDAAYLAKDYLVVEVALFPPQGETIEIRNSDFSLRINGKKTGLTPEAVSMVAGSLQHPEWEQSRTPTGEVDAGTNNAGVVIGGPPRNNNPFPGSQPPGSQPPGSQLPPRVDVPKDNPSGVEKPRVKADVIAVETALVEGPHHAAFSGFLYFAYRGKPASVKNLELVYQDTILKLK